MLKKRLRKRIRCAVAAPLARPRRYRMPEPNQSRGRPRRPLSPTHPNFWLAFSARARAILLVPRPRHQPRGSGDRSRAPPSAFEPPVCPSSDFWASSQVCAPLNPAFRPSNAACCSSCATPRCHPGPCRSHHHHPSPGRPPASISFHPSDPPFGRSCIVPAPSVCPVCRSSCGASSDRCGRQGGWEGGRSSGLDGRSVSGGGGGGLAARMAGGDRARARSGVSDGLRKQQPSSSSSSIRGSHGRRRPPMAAWEAAARRRQPSNRGRRLRAAEGVAGARRECSRMWPRCAMLFQEKSAPTRDVFSRVVLCVSVYVVCVCIPDSPDSPLRVGTSNVSVA